jgi:hypothetical protein
MEDQNSCPLHFLKHRALQRFLAAY